jgi:hypothetical protein
LLALGLGGGGAAASAADAADEAVDAASVVEEQAELDAPPVGETIPAALPEEPAVAKDAAADKPVPKPEEPPAETPPAPGAFVPPVPEAKAFDWIQLKSGEWLKGKIDLMRDRELEFDSDKLDDLEIDWEDVSEIHTRRVHTYVFDIGDERVVVTGTAILKDGVLRIRTEDADTLQTFESKYLMAIIRGRPSERNYWRGSLSFGLAVRAGNTNQADLTTVVDLKRETPRARTNIGYNGAVGILEDVISANNHRATAKHDMLWWHSWYVTPLSFEYFRDTLQNIATRITPSAGVGYHIKDQSGFDWDVELAAGYQYTENVSSFMGIDPLSSGTGALIFRTWFDVDITKAVEWDGEYKLQLGVPDLDQTNHHLLTTVSLDLVWKIDFDVTFVWDRNESPDREADGNLPVKNDYRLTFGLGIDF